MSRTRRAYDPEFKDEAVKLVINTGRSIAKVATEVGVPAQTLGKWVNAYKKQTGEETPLSMSERAELNRLRKAEKEWELDRAFLKKASVDSTGQRNTIENVLGGVMWQKSVDQGSRLIDGSKCGKCGRQAHQSARLVELWALRQAPSSQSCCPMVGSISRSRGVALAH